MATGDVLPPPARRPRRPRITSSAGQLILSALRDAPLSVPADEIAAAYTEFILRRLVTDLDDERLSLLLVQAQDSANHRIAEQASV